MKKILVATDFSEYADFAIKTAVSIAKETGAQLIILHVINRPLNSDDDSYENYHNIPGGNTIVCNIQDKLDAIVSKHNIKEAKVIYELRYDVFKAIIKHADRHKVDLIVMGAYGHSESGETFVGSSTERVMMQAKMPVLVVNEKFEELNIENMVFASEFYGDVFKVFPKMKKIIDLFQSKVHLLKVNTPNHFQRTEDSLKMMKEFCSEFDLKKSTKNIYNDKTIEDGIINFTQQIDADLIAITPDGYWRLAHLFNKNITEVLIKKSTKAILSMKAHQPIVTPEKTVYKEHSIRNGASFDVKINK